MFTQRPRAGPQVSGTTERPRLAVFRSNQHIYAQVGSVAFCHQVCHGAGPVHGLPAHESTSGLPQVIDDTQNKTLYGLGSVSEAVQAELEGDKISKTKSKARTTHRSRFLATSDVAFTFKGALLAPV